MNTPFFLYSKNHMMTEKDEMNAVVSIFGEENVSDLISDIPMGSIVFPRYRAIPFGSELERDVERHKSKLINTYREHRNLADIFSWYFLLNGLTPEVYTIEDIPYLPEGEYFVKGETNSKKNDWFESAYAPNRKSVLSIVNNILSDNYVGSQKIAIRPFQNYRQLGQTIDNRPIFHERRAFVLDREVLTSDFYWSPYADEYKEIQPIADGEFESTLDDAIDKIGHLARFLVIDLAEYPDGKWGVVELNDGSMSGLSENSANVLWQKVFESVSHQ